MFPVDAILLDGWSCDADVEGAVSETRLTRLTRLHDIISAFTYATTY